MERNPFLLKQFSSMESTKYVDLWIDANKIDGYLIPFDRETERQDENTVNLLYRGDVMTVKQERHIMEYLVSNFSEDAKDNVRTQHVGI